MSEQTPEEAMVSALNSEDNSVAEVVETPPVAALETSQGHPAWQEVLSAIPESLHSSVRPTLENWDKGVNERLEKVQSQYAPYQSVIDGGLSAEELSASAQLFNALNADPAAFIKNLQDYYKVGSVSDQGQPQPQGQEEVDLSEYGEDLSNHPQFKQLKQMQDNIAQQLQAQQQAQQDKDAEIWIESRKATISNELKEKGLDPDFDYILNRAAAEAQKTNNFDKALDNARDAYVSMLEKYRAPVAAPNAPAVIPPTGSVPVQSFNSTNLSDAERKALMVQMLGTALKD